MNQTQNEKFMRLAYPAELWHSGTDEVVVSFRDIEWCHTSGVDEAEALEDAQDALEEAIAALIADNEPISPCQVSLCQVNALLLCLLTWRPRQPWCSPSGAVA